MQTSNSFFCSFIQTKPIICIVKCPRKCRKHSNGQLQIQIFKFVPVASSFYNENIRLNGDIAIKFGSTGNRKIWKTLFQCSYNNSKNQSNLRCAICVIKS